MSILFFVHWGSVGRSQSFNTSRIYRLFDIYYNELLKDRPSSGPTTTDLIEVTKAVEFYSSGSRKGKYKEYDDSSDLEFGHDGSKNIILLNFDLAGISNINDAKLKFYFEETMLMLMNWCKYFLADIKQLIKEKNISVQEAFTELTPVREQKFSSEEYSVRGFIDAVHHCGDEIHILDYKTNARFDMKESIKLQLAIYSLLYQEKKGVMPHKVGIFFLRHKSKYMNVEPGLIELAKREINSIHSHTSSTEHVDDYPQTITPLCKWSTGQCDFYKTCKPHDN